MDTHARIYTRLDTTSDHESNRMVTVSFDFSQIPAQWVARNSCGKKVVKSVGRGGESLLPRRRGRFEKFHPTDRGDWFFSSKSAFLFASFLTFSRRGKGEGRTYFSELILAWEIHWREGRFRS